MIYSNILKTKLDNCDICPRNCFCNRNAGDIGYCGMGNRLVIASFGEHFGEEPEIVGNYASGTIFFSGCNLLCNFCQNFDISHFKFGKISSITELSNIMLDLQQRNCENINLVTPTHFSPLILEAIILAKDQGLDIPIVYNSSAYEKVETLKAFEGLIDIYMPDLKFIDPKKSALYCKANDYFQFAIEAISEMHRQVGDLIINNGVAKKGLLIRHLVFPNNQSDTNEIINVVANKFGTNTYLNLMDQYHPCYKANKFDMINRNLYQQEFLNYVKYAKSKGFYRPNYLYDNLK